MCLFMQLLLQHPYYQKEKKGHVNIYSVGVFLVKKHKHAEFFKTNPDWTKYLSSNEIKHSFFFLILEAECLTTCKPE